MYSKYSHSEKKHLTNKTKRRVVLGSKQPFTNGTLFYARLTSNNLLESIKLSLMKITSDQRSEIFFAKKTYPFK